MTCGGHPLRHALLIYKAFLGILISSIQMRMQGQRFHFGLGMMLPFSPSPIPARPNAPH